MLSLVAERALLQEDYDAYYQAQNDRLYNIRDTIDQNNTQVAELEAQLAEFEIGSDEWIKTRDQIWNIKRETAQLENESIKIEQEIARQRLAQITQALTRATKYYEHTNTMMQSYGQLYQRYGNYEGYRNTLDRSSEDWVRIQQETEVARQQTLDEMATLEIGSAAWYNARDAVYAFDETLARCRNEIENLEQLKNMSFLEEIQRNFEDATLTISLSLTAVRNAMNDALGDNNTEEYKRRSAEYRSLLEQRIAARNEMIAADREAMANMVIGTPEWREARNRIMQAMTENYSDQYELDNWDDEIQRSLNDEVLERMRWGDSQYEHNLSLIQYDQTMYQNRDELTNYGLALERENKLRQQNIDRVEEEIRELEELREANRDNAEEYNRLTEEIMKKEEAVRADSNAIEENNRKLEENKHAIRETRLNLEELVEKELKEAEERRRKELSSTVSMEKLLIDTLKQQKKNEWEILKKDIQKQKEALQEYKKTLNDRLNARKNAINIEEKYRQLEEYQQQLTLISGDTTRTKDAKTLREQIRSLERDIAMDRATEAVNSESEAVDSAIQSLDDYTNAYSEELDALLADSNNFSDEVSAILAGSFEGIVAFLSESNDEFKNATDIAKSNMIESWKDMFNDMYSILPDYRAQIDEILSSQETFMNFMQNTPGYVNASVTQQEDSLQTWAEMYQRYTSAVLNDLNNVTAALHSHERAVGSDDSASANAFDWSFLTSGIQAPEDTQDATAPDVDDYGDVGQTEVEHIVNPTNIDVNDDYAGVGQPAVEENYDPHYAEQSTPTEEAHAPDPVYEFDHPTGDNTPLQEELSQEPEATETQERAPVTEQQPEAKKYKIQWYDWDHKTLLKEEEVEEGKMPAGYSGALERTDPENKKTYKFDYWEDVHGKKTEIVAATKDKIYYAHYKGTDIEQPATQQQQPTQQQQQPQQTTTYYVYDRNGYLTNYTVQAVSSQQAQRIVGEKWPGMGYSASPNRDNVQPQGSEKTYWHNSMASTKLFSSYKYASDYAAQQKSDAETRGLDALVSAWEANQISSIKLAKIVAPYSYQYLNGGLVDYTGPAWVDGTKSNPEAFLSATDTESLRQMLDAFNYIKTMPFTTFNAGEFAGNSQTIGDVYVTINQAELKDDADLDKLANEVGNKFVKQLSKQGFNMARYSL